jgi:hypothetical protein
MVMLIIPSFFMRSLKISTIPPPGSTEVISFTSGASGIASVPGPAPISSIRKFFVISSPAIVVFIRSSYSLRDVEL